MRPSLSIVAGAALAAAGLPLAGARPWPEPTQAAPTLAAGAVGPEALSRGGHDGDPGVVRSRFVSLDTARLPDPGAGPDVIGGRIALNLFEDAFVEAVFERFDPNAAGATWVGHVDGVPGSSVTLAYGQGLMHGGVVMPSGTFQIRPAAESLRAAYPQPGGQLHVIAEVDQGALPREGEPIVPDISEAAIERARDVPMADAADTIDVMVVYTPRALQAAGGAAGMTNLINLGISETNTSYLNSDVKHRVRLAHAALVDYAEGGAFSPTLVALRSGQIPGVSALRDQYRADLVMLLVNPASPDACGIAYVMTSVSAAFAPFAYSVTDTRCVSPGLTMAHEWGHNMGGQHDWFVNASRLPFPYAHGYVNTRPDQRWRTVMAYNDACARQGFSCTRLLAWSNPDSRQNPLCTAGTFTCRGNFWFLPGERMGVPAGTRSNCSVGDLTSDECDADDHRALNETALTVANFRQAAAGAALARR